MLEDILVCLGLIAVVALVGGTVVGLGAIAAFGMSSNIRRSEKRRSLEPQADAA
jgi:hypothetical protein